VRENLQFREIYKKISSQKGLGVNIRRSMCFYSPEQVLRALTERRSVVGRWLSYVELKYVPPAHDLLLIYPCSTEKPYPRSRSYVQLFKTLSQLGRDRKRVHLVTISEPFGIIPEEFYRKWKNWYDCPGLFKWWCVKYGIRYSEAEANRCIQILGTCVGRFLGRSMEDGKYSRMLAFVRTYSSSLKSGRDHTHRRILELAAAKSEIELDILPPRALVSEIVRSRGRLAWDMYGVAHPMSQQFLLRRVRNILSRI